MTTTVPMSHPAVAVKNSDGTWSVRIQHTVDGTITTVDFSNAFYAQELAKGYADLLNAKAAVEIAAIKLASDLGPVADDMKQDTEQVVADAKVEAENLVNTAKTEAEKLMSSAKSDASALAKSAETEASVLKTDAEKLLASAKTEAEKLLAEARTEVAKLLSSAAAKVQPTPPAKTEAPSSTPPGGVFPTDVTSSTPSQVKGTSGGIKAPKPPVVEEE